MLEAENTTKIDELFEKADILSNQKNYDEEIN
jgi:hypothetical protein